MRNKLRNTEFMNPNEAWAREVNQAIQLKLMDFCPYAKEEGQCSNEVFRITVLS